MIINVYCDGTFGNHIRRRHLYPLWLEDGRLIIKCELCRLHYHTTQERWAKVQDQMRNAGVYDITIQDIGGLQDRSK